MKPWYQSKTIIVGALTAIAGVLDVLPQSKWVVAGAGVVIIALRLLSKTPVS